MRPAFATSALVEKDDAIDIGIEEAPHLFGTTTARASVQEHSRLSMRVAGLLIIDFVAAADFQMPGMVGFDGGVQGPPFGVAIHGRHYERVPGGIPRVGLTFGNLGSSRQSLDCGHAC